MPSMWAVRLVHGEGCWMGFSGHVVDWEQAMKFSDRAEALRMARICLDEGDYKIEEIEQW